MIDNKKLRLAIQKSGRLSDDSLDLLKRSGLRIRRRRDQFIAHCDVLPVDVLFVRDDDIPRLVMDDVADLGIVGKNVLREVALDRRHDNRPESFEELVNLNFGGCRLSIALPTDEHYDGPGSLEGKRIATSYPNLLQSFLADKGVKFQTFDLNGAVEIAPRAGLADAICDLVSSGATLEANGLREVETIFRSTAVLVRSTRSMAADHEELIQKLLTRFEGVISALESKYIMLHAPKSRLDEIIALLPGVEDPTVLALSSTPDKVAVHVVSRENLFWETMENLKELGASSILVLPIEKMLG